MTAARPLPVIDEVNAPYWEGARQHRLVLLRCQDCQKYIHPPRPACPRCQSERVAPGEVSGKGAVYSFSIMRRGGNPGFEEKVPFAVVVVELAEEPGLITIGNMPGTPLEEIAIGMPVEVTFEEVSAEVTLPQWRPRASATGGAR